MNRRKEHAMKTMTRLFAATAAIALWGFSPVPLACGEVDAVALLDAVDDNEVFGTISYRGEMIIDYKGKRFVKTMEVTGRGNRDSYIEFTNPEDGGTKYLKKDGRLYVYSPDTEQVMLISGHMLKESMMGSDLSYEDTIENERLSARYVPTLAGTETFAGREVWVLDLAAKKKTESYPRQRLRVDRETGDLLHAEYFALSGARLKEYTLLKALPVGGKRFPVESEMRDLLRKGSKTTFLMTDVRIDEPIADSVFTTRNLR